MAQLPKSKVLLLMQILIVGVIKIQAQETPDTNTTFEDLSQFVLERFNDNPDSVYIYKSANVIKGYAQPQNDSESSTFYLNLNFSIGCNDKLILDSECFPKNLICEVYVTVDPTNGKTLQNEETKCDLPAPKEQEPEKDSTDSVSFEQQKENAKTMFDDLGPFLLKHLNPLSEEVPTSVQKDSINIEVKPTEQENNHEVDHLINPVEETTEERVDESSDVDTPVVPEVVEEPIIKKQIYCTGCLTDINVNLPALQEFAEQALTSIDENTNNLYKHNILRIAKAQKQIVSGVKYILTIEIAETYCLKSSGQDRETCEPSSDASRTCVIEFLEKPWLRTRDIISNNCTQDKYNNLENEIEPHFAHKSESDRQNIFDYLDAMDEPLNDMETPQYESEYVPEPYEQEAQEEEIKPIKVTGASDLLEDKIKEAKEELPEKEKESSEESYQESEELEEPGGLESMFNREKREVRGGNRFGGLKDIRESEKRLVHDLAELAVQTLDEIDADESKRVVLQIVDAKKQLVDGVMYHLKLLVATTSCSETGALKEGCLQDQIASPKICSIQMHRSFAGDSPNDVKVVKSECNNEPRGRNRRDELLGGFRPAKTDDPYIQDIASFALIELDKTSNSLFKNHLVRIVEAKQQTVSGLSTHLKLELGESNCRKDDEQATLCQLNDANADALICNVTIWDQPWLKNRQLTNSSCSSNPSRRKRSAGGVLVGGPMEIDLKDERLQTIAHLSLAHLEGISNSLYAQKIVKVLRATRQVVSGTKYTITMEIGYTSCRKGQSNSLVSECPVKADSNNQICTLVVWDRPWLKDTHVVSQTCAPAPKSQRRKRSVKIGGGSHDIHIGIFQEFMAKHNKEYPTKEEMKRRFHIFRANMIKINTLQKTEQGTGKYGPTRFADLTSKEFKKLHLGLKPELKSKAILPQATIPKITLPTEFDWRHYNVVTPVKNQGMCGSCWAFSVTGNVEGQWALRRGELLSLSEQELVDCDKLDDGCQGGLPTNAYEAITSIGGLETETDYPYDGADETCHFNKTEVKVTVTGGLNITTNEDDMAKWLVKNGPISIGINANAMQFYMGGVSHPWKMLCSPNNLDHGVLIVGFGVHKTSILHRTLPYWIIKNSWGSFWGEQGYYRVYRGDGTCGVNLMASSAVIG